MLLSTVEYLDQALEYDRLAREAIKPSDRTKYANRAEYYRWFAGEREKIPDADIVAAAAISAEGPDLVRRHG
jgi:hypothetical protein